MLEVLKFIFSNFWIWLGFLIMLMVFAEIPISIVKGLRKKVIAGKPKPLEIVK